MITEVYGSMEGSLLHCFLEELDRVHARWGWAWCTGGDFSEVLEPGERNGGDRRSIGI